MFNMKKLWKKMCVLGVSAVTALSFSSPFVKAVAPTAYDLTQQSNVGVLVGTTTIGGNLIPYVMLTLRNKDPQAVSFNVNDSSNTAISANLDYSGDAWQLINSVSNVRVNVGNSTTDLHWLEGTGTSATKVNLYLRVDTVNGSTVTPGTWVHIANASNLEDVNLKKSEVGQYQIRYYIDHLSTPYSDAGAPSESGT